jgi:DNA-directed RNA polymerase specialized sigma24 family protein
MRGDLPEFEEFVAARQERLLGVAFLLTRDHHRAEDLLQDAFLKVYRRGVTQACPSTARRICVE